MLSADDRDRLERLLDIEGHEMAGEHREAELLALLERRLTPLSDEFASAAALAEHEHSGTFKAMGIIGPARAAMARAH
jgi:hypothetical protein